MKRFLISLLFVTNATFADMLPEPGGRLLATGGVTQIEGTGGGGLVPWALITGYGTRDQVSATAFYTVADPTDFERDDRFAEQRDNPADRAGKANIEVSPAHFFRKV